MAKRLKSRAKLKLAKPEKPRIAAMCKPLPAQHLYDLQSAFRRGGYQEDEVDLDLVRRNHGDMPRLSQEELDYQDDRGDAKPSEALKKNPEYLHDLAEQLIYVDTNPLRFKTEYKNVRTGEVTIHDRSYLKPLYNMCEDYPQGSRNQIWCTSRQMEKCVRVDQPVLMGDGSWKPIGEVSEGDLVVSMSESDLTMRVSAVTKMFLPKQTKCFSIRTKLGHEAVVGEKHPIYRDGEWALARDLRAGDRIAVPRRRPGTDAVDGDATEEAWAVVAGWLVSEGYLREHVAAFSNTDPAAVLDLIIALNEVGIFEYRVADAGAKGSTVRFHVDAVDALSARLPMVDSFSKELPGWLWRASRGAKAAFLNRLWGGDGYTGASTASSLDVSYCSVSKQLCRDVQSLLLEFGIPSRLRSFTPSLYKGTDQVAWEVRLRTRDGVKTFLREIGAFGKGLDLCDLVGGNDCRDTLPKTAAQSVIDETYGPRRNTKDAGLFNHGLSRTLAYPPSRAKWLKYCDAFETMGLETAAAERLASEDIFWDEVAEVHPIGEHTTVDMTVEGDHTFVVGGIITHNSTTMTGKSITLGVAYDAFKTLFISPRFDQVSVFSGQRFKPMSEDSPVMREHFIDPAKCLWQVGQREFKNRSFFNFRSCYATADGSRGITAHHLAIDEIQDIISDNIPVLEECQSHFGWDTGMRFRTYAGTPKSLNNTITKRFNESCQFEMLINCKACNHWNYPDEKIVGLNHYICTKCGKEIFPKLHGQWIPMQREYLDKCWGFRITQIAVPFKTHADIKEKMDDPLVSQAKFFNECLGLPYDSGEMVLTDAALRQACDDRRMIDTKQAGIIAQRVPLFAGLDHGSGEGDSPSYTALTIGYFNSSGKFDVVYMHRFMGKESGLSAQPALIDRLCREAGVTAMMADWGFGAHQNARLVDEYGWSWDYGEKVLMQAQYVNQNAFAKFDKDSYRYRIDRTASMEQTITALKNGSIRLFSFNDFVRFKDDFTSIFVEFNETTGRSKFDHVDNDDCFHSLSYAYMAALQFNGKLTETSIIDPDEFTQPGQSGDYDGVW